MIRFIEWLGRNKLIAVLLSIIVYFTIVAFHQVITDLAIKLRNAIGRDRYNEYIAYFFLFLLLVTLVIYCYYSLKGRQKFLKSALFVIIIALMVISFKYLMTYSIEAIHFPEYMLVAILLIPVLRSYGETVFWVTILGIMDELFQYIFLVPDFDYLDFNDIILNLIGAGAGAIMIFNLGKDVVPIRPVKWYRSPAIFTGAGLIAFFSILLLNGKMTINPADPTMTDTWFSLNRKPMPGEFWKEAYPGRVFHILRPYEGVFVMCLLFTGFFILDLFVTKSRKRGTELSK
jgi:hypothetical protein